MLTTQILDRVLETGDRNVLLNKDIEMDNGQSEYQVLFHVTFHHVDGRKEIVSDEMIIEARSSDQAKRKLLNQFNNSDEPITQCPDGWFGEIENQELDVDNVKGV